MRFINDYRDRDFLETTENLFFTVVGNIHPSDKVLAYLKYYPSFNGKWVRFNQKFDRAIKYYDISHLKESMNILSKGFPNYLYRDPFLNISFTAVSINSIKTHYAPEKKLKILSEIKNLDQLQRKAVDLAISLSEKSKIPLEKFGITGSLLIDLHQLEFSDIDLTVYGKATSAKARKALIKIFRSDDSDITRIIGETVPTPARQSRLRLMNETQLKLFYKRKWNRGLFKGTPFSVNPVLEPNDLLEKYTEVSYTPLGMIEAEAIVTDDSESIFVPAKYQVSDVKITKGSQVDDIIAVVSFDRDYGDIAYENEKIHVRGKLEKVTDLSKNIYHYRIVVGSLEGGGSDYIKVAV